jgi:hypothetical protein
MLSSAFNISDCVRIERTGCGPFQVWWWGRFAKFRRKHRPRHAEDHQPSPSNSSAGGPGFVLSAW